MTAIKNLRNLRSSNHFSIDLTNVEDNTLSWKAKGIFLYLLSLKNDDCYLDDIVKQSKDKKSSFFSGLKELTNSGYLYIEKEKEYGWNYFLSEISLSPEEFKEILQKQRKG